VSAIEHHHHPERAAGHEDVARVVYLADRLSHWALDEESSAADFALDDASVESLGSIRRTSRRCSPPRRGAWSSPRPAVKATAGGAPLRRAGDRRRTGRPQGAIQAAKAGSA
jgi:hypothetical protein